jgi:hypothetical protein
MDMHGYARIHIDLYVCTHVCLNAATTRGAVELTLREFV